MSFKFFSDDLTTEFVVRTEDGSVMTGLKMLINFTFSNYFFTLIVEARDGELKHQSSYRNVRF